MGCCMSCCCLPYPNTGYRTPSSTASQNSRSFGLQHPCTRPKQPLTDATYVCDLCGATVDIALIDGHKEVCKANHLRALLAKNAALLSHASLQPSSSMSKWNDDTNTAGDKELCVVCMDRPRCYAFLPCGHICCCGECTKSLEQCPLCRQPREALCYVSANVTSQYECKHCHELIAPTLFDGHREVCGLRQRQKQQEAEAEAEAAAAAAESAKNASPTPDAANQLALIKVDADDMAEKSSSAIPPLIMPVAAPAPSSTPTKLEVLPRSSPARSHAHVCLECGKTYGQLVVCVPCGHRVLCYTCAKKRTTCPVCVSEIRDTIVAFD